jgi:Rrf2 family protein
MQLTRAADYALRAMIHLAGLPAGQRASSAELAEVAAVSESFLAKVLQKLVMKGLVISHRGQGGGFQLGVAAADISMLDVVEGVEGSMSLNCCLNPSEGCDRRSWCAAHLIWADAQKQMREILSNAKLDRLAQDSKTALATIQKGTSA